MSIRESVVRNSVPPMCWVARRLVRRPPTILMYHGVSVASRPQWVGEHYKHLPVDTFAAQLRQLRQLRTVLPLSQLIEGLRSGEDLSNTAAITFDDGYRNNVTRAAPVLADLGLPASFFLSTGYIGVDRWMWTDRLERAIGMAPGAEVTIPVLGRRTSLHADRARLSALRRLKEKLKTTMPEIIEWQVAEIEAVLGVPSGPPEGDARFMSWGEAGQLASAGFEIGPHSVNHPILARVGVARANKEILTSRDQIVAQLGACLPVFCYPNGRWGDYSAEVMEICRNHFRAALSTNRGPAQLDDLYELRRLGAPSDASESRMISLLIRQR